MIKSQLDPLMAEIKDLKRDRDIQAARNRCLESKVRVLERRIDDGEQYSKRQNLILDGIPLKRGETPDSIRDLVLKEIERLGLDIDDYELDRAHRIDSPYIDHRGYRQQPVIARFISWSARNTLYQARKQSRLYCSADLTPRRQDILDKARQKIEIHEHIAECIDFVFVDKNCVMQARSHDGRFFGFSSELEFDTLPAYIDSTTMPRNRALPGIEFKYWGTFYNNTDNKVHPKLPEPLSAVLQRLKAVTAPSEQATATDEQGGSGQVAALLDSSDISSLAASPTASPSKQVL